MLPRESKPSSWLTISSMVRCTSLSPPAPSSKRAPPMASISSKNTRQAFLERAICAAKSGSRELCKAGQIELLLNHEGHQAGLLRARHLRAGVHTRLNRVVPRQRAKKPAPTGGILLLRDPRRALWWAQADQANVILRAVASGTVGDMAIDRIRCQDLAV